METHCPQSRHRGLDPTIGDPVCLIQLCLPCRSTCMLTERGENPGSSRRFIGMKSFWARSTPNAGVYQARSVVPVRTHQQMKTSTTGASENIHHRSPCSLEQHRKYRTAIREGALSDDDRFQETRVGHSPMRHSLRVVLEILCHY